MTLSTTKILPTGIVEEAKMAVFELFKQQQDTRLVFHTFNAATELAEQVEIVSKEQQLPQNVAEILLIAAWFYPTGYLTNYDQPAAATIANITSFLNKKDYPTAKTEKIKDLIRLVEAKKIPVNEEQEVFHDAFWGWQNGAQWKNHSERLKLEQELKEKAVLPPEQFAQLQLAELLETRFYTEYGKLHYEPLLAGNLLKVKSQIQKLRKKQDIYLEEASPAAFEGIENNVPQKGIQTFFRSNYRIHINLSAIADNKANIMISVNAILLSVLISLLTYRNITESRPMILMAVIVFFMTGLTSLVFAILSARPKVTALNRGKKDHTLIKKNVVFFGNFVHLDLDQFEEAMDAVFRDSELMYGNMVRDLYYLGKVLDKKYRYLTISYNIFMIGFVATTITFLAALLLG